MSVDKGIFNEGQRDTYDFHESKETPWRSNEEVDRYVPTHCCYCGVQCGMNLKVSGGKVVGVEPRNCCLHAVLVKFVGGIACGRLLLPEQRRAAY